MRPIKFPLFLLAVMFGSVKAPAMVEDCVFRQPWQHPRPALSSRVESCNIPRPSEWVLMDDFTCDVDGVIRRLDWWGWVLDPEQIHRPFYIAIYSDAECKPDAKLYETCVIPRAKFVDFDCEGRPIHRFRAKLPNFKIIAGEHLWVQISADEEGSIAPGEDVFRWSTRQPQRLCDAAARNSQGQTICPLFDPCQDVPVDLSFVVFVKGH